MDREKPRQNPAENLIVVYVSWRNVFATNKATKFLFKYLPGNHVFFSTDHV